MTIQPNLFENYSARSEPEILDQLIEAISIQKDLPGAELAQLVPSKALLVFTYQYSVEAIHLSKILKSLPQIKAADTESFKIEIGNELSISKNRTSGLYYVIREMGLITSRNNLSPLGRLVSRYSPFIDNLGLLWLFHFLLASNAKIFAWSHLFNGIFYKEEKVSIQKIKQEYSVLSGRWSDRSLKKNVRAESKAILNCYLEGFLKPLCLITMPENHVFFCDSNNAIIPPLIWLSALMIYRDRYYPEAPSLEIPLIINANFSPGRIFRQDQVAVRKVLDELHNAGLLTVETRSGLDQVRFKREITWLSAAAQYLKGEAS